MYDGDDIKINKCGPTNFTASVVTSRPTTSQLFEKPEVDNRPLADGFFERGVSVDQDGKSNVWAIEPKVELDAKSSEEKGQTAIIAGGGLAAFAAFATLVLTNLPDPNQF